MLLDETRVVFVRPLQAGDKVHLLDFFKRIPEEERFYLKENVTSPEVIQAWTANIDFGRVIPILALTGTGSWPTPLFTAAGRRHGATWERSEWWWTQTIGRWAWAAGSLGSC